MNRACFFRAAQQNRALRFNFINRGPMPRLILLRHAKSDWDSGALSDFDRPVSARGSRELPVVAAELAPYLDAGSLVLCSSAKRTQQTYDLARPHWPDCAWRYLDSLYECGPVEMGQAVRQVDRDVTSLVVIAHNPGLVMFLNWCLADDEVTADCFHMPTSCAAVLDLAQPFAQLEGGQARLAAFIRAKDLIARQAAPVTC